MEHTLFPKVKVNPELETPREELEEIRRLRLCRRMQAVTIDLCVAFMLDFPLRNRTGSEIVIDRIAVDEMKKYVSRVCGLTDKDFERIKDGTQKTEKTKVFSGSFVDIDPETGHQNGKRYSTD